MSVEIPAALKKFYVGDSVYVEWTGCDYILTTENDDRGPGNIIILEPQIFRELVRFVERCEEFRKTVTP